MSEQTQTVFPDNGNQPASAPAAEPIMLEGMKVLFDEKVGLYPVDLVALPAESQSYQTRRNGNPRRIRVAARI